MLKPSRNFLTDRSKAVLLLWILFAICVKPLSLSNCIDCPCSLVVTWWERADLLALLYVFLCFYHFPMWCPGSSVVLDCLDY